MFTFDWSDLVTWSLLDAMKSEKCSFYSDSHLLLPKHGHLMTRGQGQNGPLLVLEGPLLVFATSFDELADKNSLVI